MLDEFIKEIKELQDYKLKYNNAINEGWFPSYKTCGNFEWS